MVAATGSPEPWRGYKLVATILVSPAGLHESLHRYKPGSTGRAILGKHYDQWAPATPLEPLEALDRLIERLVIYRNGLRSPDGDGR